MGKILDLISIFFTKNVSFKLISLVFGCGLWLFVMVSKNTINDFPGNLPLEMRSVPKGLIAIYDPQKIKVKLNTTSDALIRLNADNFDVYADLANLNEGTHNVDIKARVNVDNVSIIEIVPNQVLVRLEPIEAKEIPLRVVFKGELKKGFAPGKPIVDPNQVMVKGAKSIIADISQIDVPIELGGESQDFHKRTSLYIPNEFGQRDKAIELTPKSVNVFVPIVPSSGTKTIGIKVKIKGEPNSNYYISNIECIPAVVEISSSVGSLQSLMYIETIEIDISELKDDLEKVVELLVPVGITAKVTKVRVKITLSANTVSRSISAFFKYKTNPGLRVVAIDPVKVDVSGPAEFIPHLTPDKVVITLDLRHLDAGAHSGIKIDQSIITLPTGFTACSWLPSNLNITLEETQ